VSVRCARTMVRTVRWASRRIRRCSSVRCVIRRSARESGRGSQLGCLSRSGSPHGPGGGVSRVRRGPARGVVSRVGWRIAAATHATRGDPDMPGCGELSAVVVSLCSTSSGSVSPLHSCQLHTGESKPLCGDQAHSRSHRHTLRDSCAYERSGDQGPLRIRSCRKRFAGGLAASFPCSGALRP
jgi:hypothetical protein